MKIEELKKSIDDYIKDRFQLETAEGISNLFCSLDEKNLAKKSILRIQRIKQNENGNTSNWKTLLIVEIQNKEEIQYALEWSAIVKDALLDPETADLYLFIVFEKDKADISIEECYNIESSEQYCRKYVQRPDKTPLELIERTFLSKLEDAEQEADAVDPINSVMAATAEKHPWFTDEEQKKWRTALLSDNSGNELVELLTSETKN
ncbi:MAG: hypothetical protein A3F72_11435 [Bacteroidetes bacterium RIFCSPLOWO2_12_FULL_35_15]|nr:MAG: hypothetical protein A3F72_11435 [Bacteroidetes bacterium RIFCSPLOWO2_12_FULL_35_15]